MLHAGNHENNSCFGYNKHTEGVNFGVNKCIILISNKSCTALSIRRFIMFLYQKQL